MGGFAVAAHPREGTETRQPLLRLRTLPELQQIPARGRKLESVGLETRAVVVAADPRKGTET